MKIFILVGQSNMLGHGNISPVGTEGTLEYVVANDPGGDYQFLVDGGGDWVVRDEVWIKDQYGNATGLTAGYGSGANDSNLPPIGSNIGPELGFGNAMGDFYEEQVLLVKAAWGGKSLGGDFRPPSSGWAVNPPVAEGDEGYYYNQVLGLVSDAIANLGTYFPDYDGGGYEIAGFCWHQGWNDRVSGTFSAEYETNMANFIRDIRSDLGVPDLPFVIATSAMDGNGPGVYSQVELAQRAMTDPFLTNPMPPDLYADFVGSVAVVDCRETYNGWAYSGLDFWQDAANSPQNQGYHWNRNAKTYLNIGLSMADQMSILAPSDCPSRLRAKGGAVSGISLDWLKWDSNPTSVQILRNGFEVAAAHSGAATTFDDAAADPGIYEYVLNFTMPGDPCPPLTVTFDGSITGLEAARDAGGITLNWVNAMPYPAIEIRRNGIVIEAAYSGTSTSYVDTTAPASGTFVYEVVPTTGTTTPAVVQTDVYWDGGTTDIAAVGDGTSDGGSGTWDGTLLNWDAGSGVAHVAWNNGASDVPVFGGASGTVTIAGGGATAGGLDFDTDGYTIDGDPLTLVGSAGVDVDSGTAVIDSVVAGTAGLNKTGNGTLQLTNLANTFTGDVSVDGGKLLFRSTSNDSATRTLQGGNFTGNIDIAEGSTFEFWSYGGSGTPQEFSGDISGDGDLWLAYNCTFILSGTNTSTGTTTVQGELNGRTARLQIASFNSVSPSVVLGRGGMQASGILDYTGTGETTDTSIYLYASGNSTKVVNNLGTGPLIFTTPWDAANGTGLRIDITTDSDLILDGFSIPGQPNYIAKRGSGTFSLDGDCELWNYVQLYDGTLEVNTALGDGGIEYSDASNEFVVRPGGVANQVTVPDTSILEVGMAVSTSRFPAGTVITSIVDATTIEVDASAGGPNDQTPVGVIGYPGALGLFAPDPGKFRWVNSATFRYAGPDDSTNRGFTVDNGDTGTWDVVGGTTLEVSGDSAPTSGKIAKVGAGTLALSGTLQHTGSPNAVSEGALLIDGDASAMTGSVNIASGATLGGTGTIGGNVTVEDGGKLAFDISTDAASHDKLEINPGYLDFIGASELTITSGGGASPGVYTLVTDSGSGITGAVPATVNLPAGWAASVSISGNDLLLTVTSTGGGATAYETWAGGSLFEDDDNGDDVDNGLAFILGAADPNANAVGLLPAPATEPGFLTLTFERLDGIAPAVLSVEYGPDLSFGNTDAIPLTSQTLGSGVEVVVVDGSPTDTVTIKIPDSFAGGGATLFARLSATEN
ncbi:hypothetical protein HAHE_23530 [Haloferula helveola]|uniref:Sialate O-acetylesterase domain-containing protein n=1 Tax=Haloferula helveola TaxID=490095 RepID=A0ABN6H467_9BACT|nr:hypothetical protein HAHE_23530 [Haloferula helveola]